MHISYNICHYNLHFNNNDVMPSFKKLPMQCMHEGEEGLV